MSVPSHRFLLMYLPPYTVVIRSSVSAFSPRISASYVQVRVSTRKATLFYVQNGTKGVQNGCRSVCKHYKQRAKAIRISNESERTMLSHLSTYRREQIIALWEEGKTASEILPTLETEGRRTLRATVRRWVFRWRTNRGLRDQHQCGRKSKFTTEIAAFLEAKLQEDDEITSVELQRLISRYFSVNISALTIRRYIRMHLKWVVVCTRFGPMISDVNKAKRSEFAQMCLDTEDFF